MEKLLKELRDNIHNCGMAADYEGDNYEPVNEAITTLDKLEEQLRLCGVIKTEGDTVCNPAICKKLDGMSMFYDPCKDCNLNKQNVL